MGRDKATLPIDGVAMATRVAGALRSAGASRVAVVGIAVGGEEHVPDDHPGEGPVGGILTALNWAKSGILVVAPCDLLHPDSAAFEALTRGLDDAGGAAAWTGADDPLPAALDVATAAPALRAAFAAGERSLRGAIALLAPALVALPAAALADADTPDDLPPEAG